ncbi:TlpA family protein disulfide reductase [Paractinoplanes brasiliensis]|uniref:Thiol-disulfide isomerase/thioredoxin n=1 Tax=Paractinoplanes brasiliensis TaxID=52695 RepID=A0A4R6JZS6_9ACTN|nr:redoxin domain-containing protein [Actinoplanes brasiliensis]TDO42400.1 thiol-disulfide isomerase/thioredoxin [Actinoplanes brasiliensis]GID29634.1 thiol:disulfide interchange protein [Actinoplanes brasiliensis]
MRRRAVLLSAAGVLLAAGCGGEPSESSAFVEPAGGSSSAGIPSPGSSSSAGSASGGSSTPDKSKISVPAALKFSGKTLDGKAFDATTLAGKPTILWFWAPWCATCASEAQSVRDLHEEYGDRLSFLGIAGMGGNREMHQFVKDLEVGAVTHLDDGAGKIWKKFKITEQSLYVVLDRAGQVRHTGYLDDLQLTRQVKALVA